MSHLEVTSLHRKLDFSSSQTEAVRDVQYWAWRSCGQRKERKNYIEVSKSVPKVENQTHPAENPSRPILPRQPNKASQIRTHRRRCRLPSCYSTPVKLSSDRWSTTDPPYSVRYGYMRSDNSRRRKRPPAAPTGPLLTIASVNVCTQASIVL